MSTPTITGEWWEHSPPACVALVQILASVPYVGWVWCWFLLSPWGSLVFPSPHKPTFPNSNSTRNGRQRTTRWMCQTHTHSLFVSLVKWEERRFNDLSGVCKYSEEVARKETPTCLNLIPIFLYPRNTQIVTGYTSVVVLPLNGYLFVNYITLVYFSFRFQQIFLFQSTAVFALFTYQWWDMRLLWWVRWMEKTDSERRCIDKSQL